MHKLPEPGTEKNSRGKEKLFDTRSFLSRSHLKESCSSFSSSLLFAARNAPVSFAAYSSSKNKETLNHCLNESVHINKLIT